MRLKISFPLAMKPSALDVFLHTNRADAWNEPPAKTLYRAHAGWASEQITVGWSRSPSARRRGAS